MSSKQMLVVFVAGALAVILLAGGAVVGWLLISEQTRILVLAALMAGGTLILGFILAMAGVGALLLFRLTWHVDVTPRTPQVVMHGIPMPPASPLPMLPSGQGPPPAAWRPERQWHVLGVDAQWKPPEVESTDE